MKKIVINLCGVKSKGGITVINNYLSQNKDKNLYVLYDNSDLESILKILIIKSLTQNEFTIFF